jgi:hypothetical protein
MMNYEKPYEKIREKEKGGEGGTFLSLTPCVYKSFHTYLQTYPSTSMYLLVKPTLPSYNQLHPYQHWEKTNWSGWRDTYPSIHPSIPAGL